MHDASDPENKRSSGRTALLLGTIVCLVILLVVIRRWGAAAPDAAPHAGPRFQLIDALVLGIVEGITEYLPVSSTGHLLLTAHVLGLTGSESAKEAADAYAVIIQLGAILAVLGLYWRRSKQMALGLLGRDPAGLRLVTMLLTAFLPAALVGLAFEKAIKHYLFGPWPIVVGWLVGGVVILFVPRRWGADGTAKLRSIEQLDWHHALIVGLFQVTAMWPGVSRSLATILGGLIAGLSLPAAVEFSFLLGLITLCAATGFELVKEGTQVASAYGVILPLFGIASSFVAAWVSVKWLVGYLQRHGLVMFGYYRIALALVTAWLLWQGIL
ncbi:MAG: undecaprenyl-diphosphate phosphatase [Planctomycetaceae bacterium]|nr:undecaprenyl-diphosphate phosphatase [Planctomycetaceae bacterium]